MRPARAAVEGPAQVVQAIATTCNEKRYSDVGPYLHSSLRSRWVEIGYKVKDYCETITHGSTLQKVEIRSEEQVGRYTVVDLTYVYSDGTRTERPRHVPPRGRRLASRNVGGEAGERSAPQGRAP